MPEAESKISVEKVRADLLRLEKQDLWQWGIGFLLVGLMTLTVFSLSLASPTESTGWALQFNLEIAVRGLVGLVLLYGAYSLYQFQARPRQNPLERASVGPWWLSLVVLLLLTVAVISLVVLRSSEGGNRAFQVDLETAVRGLVGMVFLFCAFSVYQRHMINQLRYQLGEQIVLLSSMQLETDELLKAAVMDFLTGLYNRRLVDKRLAEEIARSERSGHSLMVMLLDLNGLKQINDQYGHSTGDLVLKAFAARMRQIIRSSDVAARIGGDEFLVLMPEYDGKQVLEMLNRMRPLKVEVRGMEIPVTFSAGWAAYQRGDTQKQLIDRADQALYVSKKAGKEVDAETVERA